MGAKHIDTTKTLPLIKVPVGTIVKLGSHLLMNVVIDTFTKEIVYYDFTEGKSHCFGYKDPLGQEKVEIVEGPITIQNSEL